MDNLICKLKGHKIVVADGRVLPASIWSDRPEFMYIPPAKKCIRCGKRYKLDNE